MNDARRCLVGSMRLLRGWLILSPNSMIVESKVSNHLLTYAASIHNTSMMISEWYRILNFPTIHCTGLTLGAVRVGALLGRVLDLCRRYQVEIDPAMSSVVVSMLVLEGLGRSLDPDLNLMKAAMPFLIGKVWELYEGVVVGHAWSRELLLVAIR